MAKWHHGNRRQRNKRQRKILGIRCRERKRSSPSSMMMMLMVIEQQNQKGERVFSCSLEEKKQKQKMAKRNSNKKICYKMFHFFCAFVVRLLSFSKNYGGTGRTGKEGKRGQQEKKKKKNSVIYVCVFLFLRGNACYYYGCSCCCCCRRKCERKEGKWKMIESIQNWNVWVSKHGKCNQIWSPIPFQEEQTLVPSQPGTSNLGPVPIPPRDSPLNPGLFFHFQKISFRIWIC